MEESVQEVKDRQAAKQREAARHNPAHDPCMEELMEGVYDPKDEDEQMVDPPMDSASLIVV